MPAAPNARAPAARPRRPLGPTARRGQAARLAARPAPAAGRRLHRPAPGGLAGRRRDERLARRPGRGLGARPVLLRRPDPARPPARRRRRCSPGRSAGSTGRSRASARTASSGRRDNPDWWPRMVMLKVLTQHAEATDDRARRPLPRALPRPPRPRAARPPAREVGPGPRGRERPDRPVALRPDRRPGPARPLRADRAPDARLGALLRRLPAPRAGDRLRPPHPRRQRRDGGQAAGAALAARRPAAPTSRRSAPGWPTSTATTASRPGCSPATSGWPRATPARASSCARSSSWRSRSSSSCG